LQTCRACGRQVPQDASRCRYCGEALTDEDDRPWESGRRGELRRDCEPHRGSMIFALGMFSLVGIGFPPLGLTLGLVAWFMAHGDLRQMRQLTMDPAGESSTRSGMIWGIVSVALSLLAIAGCGGWLLVRLP
jgi:hypothetical protein